MLQLFDDYFRQIEMPGPIVQRAHDIYRMFSEFIPQPLRNVFVSDLYDDTGTRRYTSLWLAAGNRLLESKRFVTEDNLDSMKLAKNVDYIEITKKELVDFTGSSTP